MKYFSDLPITHSNEDILNRHDFTMHMLDVIKSVPEDETFVLGLDGSWGSGKSSLINLLKEELDNENRETPKINFFSNLKSNLISRKKGNHEKPIHYIFIEFNPWNCFTNEQLLEQFFLRLGDALCSTGFNPRLKLLGRSLKKYRKLLLKAASACASLASWPIISVIIGLLSKIVWRDYLPPSEVLEKEKNNLNKKLKKLNIKVIVAIDDIDRLTKEQICMVFQLIATVVKLPSLIYVLAFDHRIVSNALNDFQTNNGSEYLEKIVQLVIPIPKARKGCFETLLDEFIRAKAKDVTTHITDNDYLHDVVLHCLNPMIRSIRDVKRFSNAFTILFNELVREIDIADIAAIAVMLVRCPQLLTWLYQNMHLICGAGDPSIKPDKCKKKKNELITSVETVLRDDDCNKWIEFLATIFPRCHQYAYGESFDLSSTALDLRGRIANHERLATALQFACADLDNIPRVDFSNALYDASSEQLVDLILQWNQDGVAIDFLTLIESSICSLTTERLRQLFAALSSVFGRISDPLFPDGIARADYKLMRTELNILNRFSCDEAKNLINNVFGTLDERSYLNFGKLIANHSLIPEQNIFDLGEGGPTLTTEAAHNALISSFKAYIDGTSKIARETNILEIPGSHEAIMLWRSYEEETCNKYIKECIESSDMATVLFATATPKWEEDSSGFSLSFDFTSKDKSSLKSELASINRMRKKECFWNLGHEYQVAIAAYDLQGKAFLKDCTKSQATTDRISNVLNEWLDDYKHASDE